MTRKQRRATLIGVAGIVLMIAAAIVLTALEDTIVFFKTPTNVVEEQLTAGERIRLGGLVAEGSVVRGEGNEVRFSVTDTTHDVSVSYVGILPDLFREGQGVVTEGVLTADGAFRADTVLARHDENYMPREVADALKEQGVWQDGNETGESATQ